jgi:hypothetical protein
LLDSNTFRFYANYGPYASGSLVIITTPNEFTTVNTFSTELPPVTNVFNVPIYQVFTKETPPAITDIPTLNVTVLSLRTAIKGNTLNFSNNLDIRQYCLGRLTLPQGGHHAYIKVLLCHGFAVSANGQQNGLRANPSNYTMDIYIYSSDGTSSIALESWGDANPPGCYHYGFAQSTTIFTKGLTVNLCPIRSDPKNLVEVWMLSHKKHGKPLILTSTTGNGNFDTSFQREDSFLPADRITINTCQTLTDLTPILLTTST